MTGCTLLLNINPHGNTSGHGDHCMTAAVSKIEVYAGRVKTGIQRRFAVTTENPWGTRRWARDVPGEDMAQPAPCGTHPLTFSEYTDSTQTRRFRRGQIRGEILGRPR